MISTDVVIVGAGPIGIELAVAFKRSGVDYVHLDAGQIGQTIYRFPPQTRFYSSNERIAIAGVPLQSADQSRSTREQYLAYLRTIVAQFGLEIRAYERVTAIERLGGDGFILQSERRGATQRYRARRIVLATGGTAHPRRLGVPGQDLPHVSHDLGDPHAFFGQRVLVVGGRNSAVEAALRCHHAGAHVALSYRRARLDPEEIKYWLLPEMNSLMRSGAIAAHWSTIVERITPDSVVLGRADGQRHEIPADFVLLMVGFTADLTLCRMAGVELVGPCETPRHDPRTMETNVPGIYIAGTAVGGTQDKYSLFIENCHVHVARIVAAITGCEAPEPQQSFDRPES